MSVTIRQRREKPMKIEQRMVQGLKWGPQVKQTALLASTIYIGQAHGGGDKCIKGGSLERLRPLFSSSFGSAHPHSLRAYYPLFFLKKLSCNTDLSIASNFCCGETELRKNYTLPQHIWCHFLDLTWLKQSWLCPCEAEAKHSRSPTLQKLLQWNLNMKKTQCRGIEKKPSVLETGKAKTNSTESSSGSVSDSRRPLVKVGSPHSCG